MTVYSKEKQSKLDDLYMDLAKRISQMSHSRRSKVGAVLVKDDNIISYGWNGTPAGDNNNCEHETEDGLVTKPEVVHAESNTLMKLAAKGGSGSVGSYLYCTLSPCIECSKLIKQSQVARVVFGEIYRSTDGIDFLQSRGVSVEQRS
jgi:dCMP deaminase